MLDIRQRTGYLLLAVLIGHVILISAQVQSRSGVPMLEAVTFGAFSRVQAAAAGVIYGVGDLWTNYFALRGARLENEALRRQVAELQVRLAEQQALAERTGRLQALLDLRQSTGLPMLAAEVIAGNPNPGVRTVTINRGSADGVQQNMAVLAPGGVIGRVIGPLAAHAARVQFLIDTAAAAGAVVERTRAGGMIVGVRDEPPLEMRFVSNLADVKPGDRVVTSGLEGIYPSGFLIGYVETAEQKGSGLYLDVTVRPSVDYSSVDDVLVVTLPPRPAATAAPGGGGR